MFVDCLTLVVVFRIQLSIRSGDGLRGFVGLETQVAYLVLMRPLVIAQSLVAEHQVVVRLQVLGINGHNRPQHAHRVHILALQEQDPPQVV